MAAGLFRRGRHDHQHHDGHVKPNGTKRRKLLMNSNSQGQRMSVGAGYGLGIYTINVIFNGYSIAALVDTGSGVPQLACTGSTVDPAPIFSNGTTMPMAQVYDPNLASPPFTLIPQNSTKCSDFCVQSYNGTCTTQPVSPGSCEYFYAYGDGSYLSGRAYSGTLSFPPPATLAVVNSTGFKLGCSFMTSKGSPYVYSSYSGLFGLNWDRLSMWQQLVSSGSVGNHLYLCLGNGQFYPWEDQSGLIVFGHDDSVSLTGPSVGGDVITLTMPNSSDFVFVMTVLSQNPTMWVSLNNISIGNTSLPMKAGSYYIIDSGSSQTKLLPDAFSSFDAIFCSTINSIGPSFAACEALLGNSSLYGYLINVSSAAPDSLVMPNITFNLASADGPVIITPTQYMYLCGYDLSVDPYLLQYCVSISQQSRGNLFGIFGNAWMTHWLFQQSPDTLQLKMTRVASCADVTYGRGTKPAAPTPLAPSQLSPPQPFPFPPSPAPTLSPGQKSLYIFSIVCLNAALAALLAISGFALACVLIRRDRSDELKSTVPPPEATAAREGPPPPLPSADQVQVVVQREEVVLPDQESSALLPSFGRST